MTNPYYSPTGTPGNRTPVASQPIRAEAASVAAAFDKLPAFAGNGGKPIRIKEDETGQEAYTPTQVGAVNLLRSGYVTRLWTYRMPSGGTFSSAIGPVTLNGVPCVLFTGLDGYIYALRADDGTLRWRVLTGDLCYGRCQAGDVDADGHNEVFAASHDGYVWSLDKLGNLRWKFANLYDREGSGTTTSATATTMTDSGKTWAANAFLRADGLGFGASLRYTSGPAAGQSREITVSPGGSTLTVGSAFSPAPTAGGGDTYVIDPKYVSDRYFQHAGTLVDEGGNWFLYITGFDNHAYKINANTGAIVWKFATFENIEPYPLVVTISGTRYCIIASVDGYVRCLNATTGALFWSAATGPCDAFIHAADVDADGTIEILVSARSGRVYILHGGTGAVKWASTITGAWQFPEINCAAQPLKLPAEARIRIVTGGDAGTAWCFDHEATTLWVRPLLPNVINASPVAHDITGTGAAKVLIGDSRGTLHCIDLDTGEPFGAMHVKGVIEGIPLYADLDSDGRAELVITTEDGYVECFRINAGAIYTHVGTPGATQWAGKQT